MAADRTRVARGLWLRLCGAGARRGGIEILVADAHQRRFQVGELAHGRRVGGVESEHDLVETDRFVAFFHLEVRLGGQQIILDGVLDQRLLLVELAQPLFGNDHVGIDVENSVEGQNGVAPLRLQLTHAAQRQQRFFVIEIVPKNGAILLFGFVVAFQFDEDVAQLQQHAGIIGLDQLETTERLRGSFEVAGVEEHVAHLAILVGAVLDVALRHVSLGQLQTDFQVGRVGLLSLDQQGNGAFTLAQLDVKAGQLHGVLHHLRHVAQLDVDVDAFGAHRI